MEILLATRNPRKIGEAELGCSPFGIAVKPVVAHFQEIQSKNPVEIAIDKSRQAFEQIEKPLVVADTFWNIPAINGFPGAYMKEVTRWFRPEDFIRLLEPYQDKRVCFTETVIYRDAHHHRVFSNDYWGVIASEPRGEGIPIEQVATFNGETIAERRNLGLFSHDARDFIWTDFAAWFAGHAERG